MDDKILDVLDDLLEELITKEEALHMLSNMHFNLMHKAKQMQKEQQYKIDTFTESYTEYELGTLTGIKRIVKLIDRNIK